MNPILRLAWFWGNTAATVFVGIAALIRGGAPERWGAALLLGGFFITPFIDNHHGFRQGIFACDICLTFGYAIIAVASRRIWAFVSTASQLLAVLTHILSLHAVGVGTWSYITALDIFGNLLPTAALAVGTLTVKPGRR